MLFICVVFFFGLGFLSASVFVFLEISMRFQSGKCDMGSACRFHHGCAYPLPTGEACAKNHGALQHDKTPH